MKLFKKILLYFFLPLLLILAIWYGELLIYGLRQGYGQLNIVWNTKKPDQFLEEGNYPDSLKVYFKEKLDYIEEVRTYAIDSLGLKASKSYQEVYDQEGRSLLWAVSAAKAFELEAYSWNYGPFGKMPYKGYFDSTLAYQLVKELEEQSLDVQIYRPAAWSTLGWFRDPILSSMLYWSEGDLASLIIHEMTHATIWINGDVEFNENLADFIGDQGALIFLKQKYGTDSKVFQNYLHQDEDYEKFYQHMLKGAQRLDSLYKAMNKELSDKRKLELKEDLILEICQQIREIEFFNPARFQNLFQEKMPNNAYFLAFMRYRSKQNQFEEEFETKFEANFQKYLAYLKEKY